MTKLKELHLYRTKDRIWWVFAALLGLWCLQLPWVFNVGDEPSRKLISNLALFTLGVIMGFARPERPWRWGVATVLLVPATDITVASSIVNFPSLSALDCLPYLAGQLPHYAVRALPAFLGAQLGAYWAKM